MKILLWSKYMITVLLLAALSGCSSDGGTSGSTEISVTVVDGYIAQAIVSDANGKVGSYTSNGIYTFAKNPEGNISVNGGYFEDSYLVNTMSMSAPFNDGVISPVTSFLAKYPALEASVSSALGASQAELMGDYVAENNLQIAKFAQVVYTMNVNGLESGFVADFGTPASLNHIFSTALIVVSASIDPDIQARRASIETFLDDLENYTGDAADIETTLVQQKMLMQNNGGVLKTGQTTSYDENGSVVTDGSLKDDGYYQKGAVRSYTRSGVGIVTDYSTGIVQMWQDDIVPMKKPWVTQENYDDGNYSDTSGDTATAYCEDKYLGDYSDWYLPAVKELSALIEYNPSTPAINPIFQHTSSEDYWSATTSVANPSTAWSTFSHSGEFSYREKENTFLIRCLRGGGALENDYSRNSISGIVADKTTLLMWQDNSIGAEMTWRDAINHCEASGVGGYDDWRLPNINELLSIVEYTQIAPSIDSVFQNTAVSHYYWSSTSSGLNNDWSKAWNVSFNTGISTILNNKKNDRYVRCVRGGL